MGKVIDFRVSAWGHNQYFEAQPDGTYYGPCWAWPSPKVGDTVLWKTNYGHVEAEVLEVKHRADPPDMSFVRSRVVKRIADPAIVSQEEIDEFFKTNS